jgi:hypothetical protein
VGEINALRRFSRHREGPVLHQKNFLSHLRLLSVSSNVVGSILKELKNDSMGFTFVVIFWA